VWNDAGADNLLPGAIDLEVLKPVIEATGLKELAQYLS
jgi:hypothetical protein